MVGAVAYLIYKLRSGGLGSMTKGGMDEILNMKKFEPIKPENIKTHFKDVAGMHEAKV